MNKNLLSIRIRKHNLNQSVKSGGKYYKSSIQNQNHDFRKENIEEGYLNNPQNKNKVLFKQNELNEEMLSSLDKSIDKDYKKHSYRNRELPKNTKKFLSGLITFSSNFQEEHNGYYDKKINEFLKKRFGESLIYTVLHTDETTPHYHFQVLNYDFKTHKTIGKHIDTSKLQDELSDFLDSQFKRGKKKKWTMKRVSNLEGKIKGLERELEEKQNELNEQKEELNTQLEELLNIGHTNEEIKKDTKKLIKRIGVYVNRIVMSRQEKNLDKEEKNKILLSKSLNKLNIPQIVKTEEILKPYDIELK